MRRWWEKVLANTKTQKQKPGVGTLGSVVEHFPASARPRVPSPEWGGRRAEAGSEVDKDGYKGECRSGTPTSTI